MYSNAASRIGSNPTSCGSKPNQNASCFTLPITCHICLAKVKDPCVCPNMHAFCSFCIEIWLEKTKQCPTCRIQINKENPCRRILGGIENFDEVDLIKPTEFTHPGTRKARYLSLFQQYEDEIERLNKYIDSLNADICKLKENNTNSGSSTAQTNKQNSPQHDMLQILKVKLQNSQTSLEDVTRERDKLKEANKKLESEYSIVMQDNARLKASLNEKNSQLSSRYTMAALESKLENYEREIKQLQRALEKSDKYIAELETKQKEKDTREGKINRNFFKENNNASNNFISSSTSSSSSAASSSASTGFNSRTNINQTCETHTKLQSVRAVSASPMQNRYASKSENTSKADSKIVKFSEKIDTIPNPLLNSPPSSTSLMNNKPAIISNDRFYGSPSKAMSASTSTIPTVMSFSDRLKKNAFNLSYDLEAPSPLSQSLNANQTTSATLYDSQSNPNANQFLFSPMKRLRLDEFTLERPSFNDEEALNNTNRENHAPISHASSMSFDDRNVTPPKSTLNQLKLTPFNYNYQSKLDKEINFVDSHEESDNRHFETSSMMNNSTSEFIDCIELLNQAEKKVQNRQLSPQNNVPVQSLACLPDKYFKPSSSTVEISSKNYSPTKHSPKNRMSIDSTINAKPSSSLCSSSSSSSSSSGSGNSISATIPTGASSLMSSGSLSSTSSFNSFNHKQESNVYEGARHEQNMNINDTFRENYPLISDILSNTSEGSIGKQTK